ncbi:MAG: family 43 glycosylhydrolase [Clostridia bacterium]|nr:family 43 glycosylhydrolase [Clostridia bacterium]
MRLDEINLRDPFVLVHEGRYYLYGTRGATCWGPADGFDAYVSGDLVQWDGPFECFHNDGDFWADRNYWAPEVHALGGAFYMFASFKSEARRRGTAILRAESPLGPFAPWSDGPVTPPEWECLDGTLYVDGQGLNWMVFCHEWVQAGDGTVCALPLTGDLRAAAGKPRVLFRGSDVPWRRRMRHSSGTEGYVTDGPFLWRMTDGALICLWASFSNAGYAEAQAVSESGGIEGPWRQLEPLFMRDGGHGMVFRGLDGKLRLALHSPNEHLMERPRFFEVVEAGGALRLK